MSAWQYTSWKSSSFRLFQCFNIVFFIYSFFSFTFSRLYIASYKLKLKNRQNYFFSSNGVPFIVEPTWKLLVYLIGVNQNDVRWRWLHFVTWWYNWEICRIRFGCRYVIIFLISNVSPLENYSYLILHFDCRAIDIMYVTMTWSVNRRNVFSYPWLLIQKYILDMWKWNEMNRALGHFYIHTG